MVSNSSQNGENNGTQSNVCRCGQGDPSMWTNRASDNSSDKQASICPNCQIIKSGHLHVSSKGIGWTSWKKRWFVLTRISLIFFRHDPNVPPIRGTEPNATLGGIDLNNSGSVVVKPDKKLLTVAFPDGRTFTLKADTLEDLNEWKSAVENALVQAPNASSSLGQNHIFRPDQSDQPIEPAVSEQQQQSTSSEKEAHKAPVVHTPAEFALEDINGDPSFLEKALCFIEDYGIKVEGILRQSADVEEVERRVHDYEQGKDEFLPNEDAHVIGDCIKLVLREMPGYPVPASCCTALVETFRNECNGRIDAMRDVIYETFPEPNRLLLQRVLRMMLVVASHKADNRMSLQALSACMAPLLLRPLLVGDLEGDFNSAAGDNSTQLLQAAAAANHAQAIVTILLEEFDHIFDDEVYSSEGYTDSEEGSHEDNEYHEGSTDNDIHDEHNDGHHDEEDDEKEEDDDGEDDQDDEHVIDIDDHIVHSSECESNGEAEKGLPSNRNIPSNNAQAHVATHPKPEIMDQKEMSIPPTSSSSSTSIPPIHDDVPRNREICHDGNGKSPSQVEEERVESQITKLTSASASHASLSRAFKLSDRSDAMKSAKRPTIWGRTSARKNLSMESMESIEMNSDEELMVEKLELAKIELQTKLATEKKENVALQASLERRKEDLHERRLALEKEMEKLQEELKKEKKLRALLESGLTRAQSSGSSIEIDSKVLEDLEDVAVQKEEISNLKQKVLELRGQSHNQLKQSYASLREFCDKKLNKDSISKKAVLSDGSDSIFEDCIDAHGLPTPCPPENKKTEPSNLNNGATEEHPTIGLFTRSKKVSSDNEKRGLPPKSVKSSRSSSSSSFGEELGTTFGTSSSDKQNPTTFGTNNSDKQDTTTFSTSNSGKQDTNNNVANNTNIATQKSPSRGFFSRGDNSKRESHNVSGSLTKKDSSEKQSKELPLNEPTKKALLPRV